MGPRLVSRGKEVLRQSDEPQEEMLQWGRDLLVAESGSAVGPVTVSGMLQWGRDLLVAEREIVAPSPVLATVLQWGRDLLVAESARSATRHR